MFVWSKLTPASEQEIWENRLASDSNWAVESVKGGKSVRFICYCATRADAEALRTRHGGSVKELADAEWQRPVPVPRPLRVRDVLLVTAATGARELAALRKRHPSRHVISIPAEMAFGTGDHATTATCLRLLADVARERGAGGWTAADLGTGTGLLAIAARALGCGSVFACDFDPLAVAVAVDNLRRNAVDGVTLRRQDVLKWRPPAKGYDVVLANLFATVLIEAWPVIARALAPGGDLVVSGILASQAWEVFTEAMGSGLGFTKVVRKGRWVTARGGHLRDLLERQGTSGG